MPHFPLGGPSPYRESGKSVVTRGREVAKKSFKSPKHEAKREILKVLAQDAGPGCHILPLPGLPAVLSTE